MDPASQWLLIKRSTEEDGCFSACSGEEFGTVAQRPGQLIALSGMSRRRARRSGHPL